MELRDRPARQAAAANEDVYDERHRQTKALAQYERQKAAWERMQAHLLSSTHTPSTNKHQPQHSSGSRYAYTAGASPATINSTSSTTTTLPNMARATATARARREDDTIIHVATAATQGGAGGGGSHAWEGLLRCTDPQEARRLVPIGRTCLPYPLYSEMRDPAALPDDHLAYARVVSEADMACVPCGAQSDGLQYTQSAHPASAWDASNRYQHERTVAQERVKSTLARDTAGTLQGGQKGKSKAAQRDLFLEDAASQIKGADAEAATYEDATAAGLSPTSYYEDQLQRFAPYVQERLGHLLQPRTFLHVEGHPAPYTTAEDGAAVERPGSAPPVEYFPPPPPPPQTQLWGSSLPTSRLPSHHELKSGPHGHRHGGAAAADARRELASSARRGEHRPRPTDSAEDGEDAEGRGGGDDPEMPRRPRSSSAATAEPPHTSADGGGGGAMWSENAEAARQSPPSSPLHPMRVYESTAMLSTAEGGNMHTDGDASNARAGVGDDEVHYVSAETYGGPRSLQKAGATPAVPLPPQRDGPAMQLSTHALFFHTRPAELLQGSATLRNLGTTTIYYSWTVVDAMLEHLRERYEAEQGVSQKEKEPQHHTLTPEGAGGGELKDRNNDNNNNNNSSGSNNFQKDGDVKMHGHATKSHVKPDGTLASAAELPYDLLRLTHHLAAHQRTARDTFFFMSAPMNGVVLPGEATVFPFSVRATREGLFQQTYELLTVPPAPTRIFVRLRALVERAGPPLTWLAGPVAESLEAKVVVDAQRRLVQRISADAAAMEAAALRARVAALDGAAGVAKEAAWALRRTQEAAWHAANRLTFDHIPFHPAVYDKLARLSAVVRETHAALTAKEEDREGHRTTGTRSVTAQFSKGAMATPEKQRLVAPLSITTSPAAAGSVGVGSTGPSPAPRVPQQTPQVSSQAALPSVESAASSPTQMRWDGALLPLLSQIMCIRDNATRQLFLEAMQVLLRAARASRDVVDTQDGNENNILELNRSNNNNNNNRSNSSDNILATVLEPDHSRTSAVAAAEDDSADDVDSSEVPLTTLLRRAAAALADVVVSRQRAIAEKQCEDVLLQPVKTAAALSLSPALPGESNMNSGGAGGGGKGRSTLASPANPNSSNNNNNSKASKKSAAAGAAAAAAAAKDSKDGAAAANSAAALTPAQRLLLQSIPTAALQGFSVSLAGAETMTVLRAAEERVMQARMESELAAAKADFTALHCKLFREVIDAACDRTPLSTCTAARLAELREVQQSAPLMVDVSVDPLVVPPAGKPGKRK